MMENPISITSLNDFIFCPASIYFHSLEYDSDKLSFQDSFQLNGTAAHEHSDKGDYSDRKAVLQGISVYSEKYNLIGKIDTFDTESGILTERKRTVHNIYDGFVFQLYGQYYSLIEMGYEVNELRLYSMSDNKVYKIEKPENDDEMRIKFEQTIDAINDFSFPGFVQNNAEKCGKCIYETLCSYATRRSDE